MPSPAPTMLDIHFREVGQYTMPTPQEEFDLFTAYIQARTDAQLATNPKVKAEKKAEEVRLIHRAATMYLRFVIRQARRKSLEPDVFSDLIGAGYEGLLHAIELFKPELGNRFLTYANNWVNVRMQEALFRLKPVHIPSHTRKEIRRKRAEAERDGGDTSAIPSEELSISSIEHTVVVDTLDVHKDVCNKLADARALIHRAPLSRLEKMVLYLTFGLRGEEHTPQEAGQLLFELDGSAMVEARVLKVQERALGKVRKHLGEEGIHALADVLTT